MASIERRARSWRVVWREDGQRRTEPFTSESGAVAFRELLDRNGGRTPDGWQPGIGFADEATNRAGGRTVTDLHAEWVDARVSPSTRQKVRDEFRTMVSGHPIAKAPIGDVTAEDARDYVAALGNQYARGTIRNLVVHMRSAYRYAATRGYVTGVSPWQDINTNTVYSVKTEVEPVFLRPDETADLIAAIGPEFQLLMRLLLGSGLRIGEALGLRVHSVRVARDGRVTLVIDKTADQKTGKLGPTKTRQTRHVPLSLPLSHAVAVYAANRAPRERLFGATIYDTVYHAFLRAVDDAGLLAEHPNGVRIHDLRHTHASDLIMAGVPLLKVSRRLGHASIVITADTYGHIHAEDETLNAELDNLA